MKMDLLKYIFKQDVINKKNDQILYSPLYSKICLKLNISNYKTLKNLKNPSKIPNLWAILDLNQ